jgi:hypothetical protein
MSTKAERKARQQKAEQTWKQMQVFAVDKTEEYTGMMETLLRSGKSVDLTIEHPTGEFEKMTGVFSFIKSPSSDNLYRLKPEFLGWHPIIVGGAKTDTGILYNYLQVHPLSVVTSGGLLMYAPWANPHLPQVYRPECRRRFPNKPMIFEAEGRTGDFKNDFQFFMSAIEGLTGPRRNRDMTAIPISQLIERRMKEDVDQKTTSVMAALAEYKKDAAVGLILAATPVKDSTEMDVIRVSNEPSLRKALEENSTPFAVLRFVQLDNQIGWEGAMLSNPDIAKHQDWFQNALHLALDQIGVDTEAFYKSQGQQIQRVAA